MHPFPGGSRAARSLVLEHRGVLRDADKAFAEREAAKQQRAAEHKTERVARPCLVRDRTIQDHFFNASLRVFLPAGEPPLLPHTKVVYHRLRDTKVTFFLQPEFLKAYVRRPRTKVYALAADGRLDAGSVAAITPDGRLHLSLDKDMYEELGLTGQQSAFNRKTGARRRTVSIDVKAEAFRPGKPGYDRALWCLARTEPTVWHVIVEVDGRAVDELPFGEAVTVEPEHVRMPADGIRVPDAPVDGDEANATDVHEFLEWFGVVAAGAFQVVDPILAAEEGAALFHELGFESEPRHTASMTAWRTTGLIPPSAVLAALDSVRDVVDAGAAPWGCVAVCGTPHAPVSWAGREHGIGGDGGGSHDYVIVLGKGGVYWRIVVVEDLDQMS